MNERERDLANMIRGMIDDHGSCEIPGDMIREVLDPDPSHPLAAQMQALLMPYSERLATFAVRHGFLAVPQPGNDRTIFGRLRRASWSLPRDRTIHE